MRREFIEYISMALGEPSEVGEVLTPGADQSPHVPGAALNGGLDVDAQVDDVVVKLVVEVAADAAKGDQSRAHTIAEQLLPRARELTNPLRSASEQSVAQAAIVLGVFFELRNLFKDR